MKGSGLIPPTPLEELEAAIRELRRTVRAEAERACRPIVARLVRWLA